MEAYYILSCRNNTGKQYLKLIECDQYTLITAVDL